MALRGCGRCHQGAAVPRFFSSARKVLFAINEARIIWGGVHGICLLGLTHRLSHDSDEILKTKVRSLIENYMKGLELNDREIKQTTG